MKFRQPILVHLSYIPHVEHQALHGGPIFIDSEKLESLPQVSMSRDYTLETGNDYAQIPLCIAGPLFYLMARSYPALDYYSRHSFLEEISDKTQMSPYSYVEGCSVCKAVQFLIENCSSYKECEAYLETKTQIFIFEVIREICNRLLPGLLVLSSDFYNLMKENDLLDIKRFPHALRTFRNFNAANFSGVSKRQKDENQILNILTIKMHELMAVSKQANLIKFIFVNWSRILRIYFSKSGILGKHFSSNAPFYIEGKIATKPMELRRIIWTLGKAIAGGLVTVANPSSNGEIRTVLIRTCMNILASNRAEIFGNEQNLRDKLIHVQGCDGSKICYCHYLENVLPAPNST
ncbi:hypothetical protein Aperf_G00000124259 [Anoplocephala perfoliata]